MGKGDAMSQATRVSDLARTIPPWYRIPAIEAFPTSLFIVHLAGLEHHLNEETIAELQETERRLQDAVPIAPILGARTQKGFERAFIHAYEQAMAYYVTSGITIWRSLNHDYRKLLKLSQVSCKLIEGLFFQHVGRLERQTFIKSVVGLRVLRNIGERIILAEEKTPPDKQAPPLSYLDQVAYATFVLWCLLSHLQGSVKKARRDILRMLADELFSAASKAYDEALKRHLYERETERNYWSPIWQEGEVEADLDKHLGDMKSFNSVEDLLKDLHQTSSDEIRTHQTV